MTNLHKLVAWNPDTEPASFEHDPKFNKKTSRIGLVFLFHEGAVLQNHNQAPDHGYQADRIKNTCLCTTV